MAAGRVSATLGRLQSAGKRMYSDRIRRSRKRTCAQCTRPTRQGRYAIRTIVPTSYPIPTDGPVGKIMEATGRHPFRACARALHDLGAGCKTL